MIAQKEHERLIADELSAASDGIAKTPRLGGNRLDPLRHGHAILLPGQVKVIADHPFVPGRDDQGHLPNAGLPCLGAEAVDDRPNSALPVGHGKHRLGKDLRQWPHSPTKPGDRNDRFVDHRHASLGVSIQQSRAQATR